MIISEQEAKVIGHLIEKVWSSEDNVDGAYAILRKLFVYYPSLEDGFKLPGDESHICT